MMEETSVRKNSLRAWILAARPKTLAGASVPVMIGLALAWAYLHGSGFNAIAALLCVLFAFIMQVDANFVNDYYDFVSGKDDDGRLGPARACAMGWIDISRMRTGILITTLLACAVGLPLVCYGGVEMIFIGILCVLFCFLYTTFLASCGMGDVLVLVFFGLIPVCLTFYLQTGIVTWQVFVYSLACGLVIDTLLIVNNYRDISNDCRAGKRTLIVMIGAKAGLRLYLWCGLAAYFVGIVYVVEDLSLAFVLSAVYAVLHIRAYKKMKIIAEGKRLNMVLADTARNMFVYGLTVAVGILLS